MAASQPGVFNPQQFTDAGLPAAGYRLYTYTSGTTTHKTAFTDAAGVVAQTYTNDGSGGQYIGLNGRGELPSPLFLTSGAYDLCLKTPAGATVWTRYATGSADAAATLDTALRADLASTASGKGDDLIGSKRQTGSGAVALTVQDRLNNNAINAAEFGVVGNGTKDDTSALAAAIAAAQANGSYVVKFAPGAIVKLTSTTALSGSPVTLVGEPYAPHQQGSTRPAVTLRWTGSAASMFTVDGNGWGFVGFAVENFGSATDFIYTTNVQRLHVQNLSFMVGSGASIFSQSIFRSLGNNFGYSRFLACHCLGASPFFIYIDGNGTSNGLTPIEISDCLFESNSTGDMTVFYLKDEQLDLLLMRGNTFNQQENELCIVNTTANSGPPAIAVFDFRNNEIDTAVSVGTDRLFQLTYCPNVIFCNNQLQGGGTVTALGELVSSTVTQFFGNQVERIAGPVFNADASSRVFPGMNYFNSTNTAGVATNPGTGKAGGVIQTVTATFSTPTTNGTTTLADTGLTASITPTCETSKIKVTAYINGISVFAATTAVSLKLLRGSTQLIEFGGRAGYAGAVTTELAVGGCGAVYLDEPAAVTATTYKVQFARVGGSGNVGIAQGNAVCTICLEEVGA